MTPEELETLEEFKFFDCFIYGIRVRDIIQHFQNQTREECAKIARDLDIKLPNAPGGEYKKGWEAGADDASVAIEEQILREGGEVMILFSLIVSAIIIWVCGVTFGLYLSRGKNGKM